MEINVNSDLVCVWQCLHAQRGRVRYSKCATVTLTDTVLAMNPFKAAVFIVRTYHVPEHE